MHFSRVTVDQTPGSLVHGDEPRTDDLPQRRSPEGAGMTVREDIARPALTFKGFQETGVMAADSAISILILGLARRRDSRLRKR